MAAEDYKTSEARAFREHYDKLVDSIQEPDLPVLGARFFSRQIISRETMEMVGNVTTSRAVRASKLMLAVMAVLETHPDKFESVLDVFRVEPVYAQFSSLIMKESQGNSHKETASSQPEAPPTTVVGKYAVYWRDIYLRSNSSSGTKKWPPVPCKKIIRLSIVERKELAPTELFYRSDSVDEYMQKISANPISMNVLLQPKDGSLPKVVVVQGVPGIGKSTFAWKFCRRWAKGKIYQQYDLVVLLRMRDTRVREATKLSNLFFSASGEISKQVTEEIISNNGKNVLLLMEGIDELPTSCLADGTLLSNLLQGELLPRVTILVTTRSWAVQMLMEKYGDQISSLVEILGFTKEDILRYLSHEFTVQEEKAEFLDYFHLHPQLESIMHIPLNAAFVVQIYRQFKRSQQAVPHTLTQLYTALVKGLLLRYMKSVSVFRELKLVDLENLPEPIKSHFEQLCLLAFMSFTKLSVQVTFTDSEAALYGCLDSLGLMQSSADLSIDTGTTVTHSFLHFTIQEFLAAYHLSKQPAQVRELFLETHKNDNQFHMLLTFLVGLNSDTLQYLREPNDSQITTSQLHWLFESQAPKEISKCLGNGKVEYECLDSQTSFDIHALFYCLYYSNCKWKLHINLKNFSSVYSTNDACTGEIHELFIISFTASALRSIFSLPKQVFSNLLRLYISSSCDIDLTLAEILGIRLLPSLKIFGCYGSHLTISASLAALCKSYHDLLLSIGFREIIITSSDMIQLCEYITSPTRSSELELVLIDDIFSEDCLQMLFSAVACSKYLTSLCLRQIKMTTAIVEILSVAVSTSSLKALTLNDCSIDGEGAELLASELEENKTLSQLDLSNNDINANGAAALGSMLEVNISLKKLNLSKNILIGTEGALRLINALEQNKTLQELILPTECEPVEYGSILFEHIQGKNYVIFA